MMEGSRTLEELLQAGVSLSPLGRRLLANTPQTQRRRLHEILLVIDSVPSVAERIERLRALRVEASILTDLARRGFLSLRPSIANASPGASVAQAAGQAPVEPSQKHGVDPAASRLPPEAHPVGRRAAGPRALTQHGLSRSALGLGPEPGAAITFDPVPVQKLVQAERLREQEAQLQRTLHGMPTDHALSRRSLSDNLQKLSPAATQLLSVLPSKLSVQHLVERYPRILNRLADDWKNPERFRATMESYFIDTRGGRQGFPLPIVKELMELRDYYDTEVHPVRPTGFAAAPDIFER